VRAGRHRGQHRRPGQLGKLCGLPMLSCEPHFRLHAAFHDQHQSQACSTASHDRTRMHNNLPSMPPLPINLQQLHVLACSTGLH
jgi:hypothetical protein